MRLFSLLLAVPIMAAAAEPQLRLVSTAPNLTEIVYAIGAGDLLVGRSSACDFPDKARDLPAVGPFAIPDPVATLELHPTHLLTTELVSPETRPILTGQGVAVVEIRCDTLDSIPDAVETVGFWTKRQAAAKIIANAIRKELRGLRRTDRLQRRALLLLDPQQPFTVGNRGFLRDALQLFGIQNAGDIDGREYFCMALDQLSELDPDLIICLFNPKTDNPAELFSDRIGWQQLRAVRSKRVYALPHTDLLVRPGPRIITGLRDLRNLLDADAAALRTANLRTSASAIRQLRLARLLTALLVGCALSLAGAVLQTLLNNPMADPYVLGVSGGASLGAAAWMATGISAAHPLGIPVLAFVAAFASLWIVCRIARTAGGALNPNSLILSGVMVSAIESSLLLLIITFATPGELHSITWWMLGNLQCSSWPLIFCSTACIALAAATITSYARSLNALMLGEPMAAALGVNLRRDVPILLAAATVATAAAVSLAGVIGFVGLMIPHLMRRLIGADHRRLLPAAAIAGALFMWLCDFIATRAAGGIPVGVVTALTGGPFFLFLLISETRKKPC